MLKIGIHLIVLMSLWLACKQDKAASSDAAQPSGQSSIVSPDTTAKAITDDYAEEITLAKPKDNTWKSYLTTEMWEYSKGMHGSVLASDLEGKWIRFNEDNTYAGGVFEHQTTNGDWTIDEQGMLHLTPSIRDDRESYWKVRKKDNSMVWSGTERFGNQNTQLFLVRRHSQPRRIYQ